MNMAKNRHWNGQGFYRPDSYFGPWSIIPDSLNHYLAIVGTLDLAVLATSAAKSDSPSTPLPTEKPDIAEKKKAKQGELADKQKRHDEMAKDIEDHSKNLQDRKDKKSETDQAEIEKSEAELEEKKKNHKALGD
jgi:Skp family chaperone for outer membrane proteins